MTLDDLVSQFRGRRITCERVRSAVGPSNAKASVAQSGLRAGGRSQCQTDFRPRCRLHESTKNFCSNLQFPPLNYNHVSIHKSPATRITKHIRLGEGLRKTSSLIKNISTVSIVPLRNSVAANLPLIQCETIIIYLCPARGS